MQKQHKVFLTILECCFQDSSLFLQMHKAKVFSQTQTNKNLVCLMLRIILLFQMVIQSWQIYNTVDFYPQLKYLTFKFEFLSDMQKKTTKKKRNNNNKSRQRPKKLKTFNQSDFSLIDDNNHLGSISDLFKNEALKKKAQQAQNSSQINFNSTVNNYASVYTVIPTVNPLRPQKVKSVKNVIKILNSGTKKRAPQKSKSKSKIMPDKKQAKKRKQKKQQKFESYELIPPSKNSLNSQIVFSTQETKRQSQKSRKIKEESSRIDNSLSFLRNNQQSLINNNKLLRTTIKQQFKRKNQAATKIQKVFRGYLTRKILQKYIKQQQQKLNYLLAEYKSSNGKQKSHRSQKSRQFDFFSNNNSLSERDHTSKTFQDEQSINLSKINPSNFRFNEQESKVSSERVHSHIFFNSMQNEIINCQNEVLSSDDNEVCDQNENEVLSSDEVEDSNQNSSAYSSNDQRSQECSRTSSEQIVVYRHQEAIYNGSQIQQFLQSSSGDEDEQMIFSGIQKQKVKKTLKHDQIIFETNEEHIQSRKHSTLHGQDQPRNKLSTEGNNQQMKVTYYSRQDNRIDQNSESNHLDLIKTSKVNSIHSVSRSHKTSCKSQKQQLSPSNKKQKGNMDSQTKQSPGEKTQKKQSKNIIPTKRTFNSKNSYQQSQTGQLRGKSTQNEVGNGQMHLQTIKITSEQYNQKGNDQKKVFMDTISYNSQFKAKHQIVDDQSSSKISLKKKDFIRKKVYYFSDSSDHAQYQSQARKDRTLTSPRNQSQKSMSKREVFTSNELQRLKNSQIKRWDEVIKLISSQIDEAVQSKGRNRQFQCFIKQVMELSLKNKEMLRDMMSQKQQVVSQMGDFKHQRIDSLLDENDSKSESEKQTELKQFKDTLSSGRRKSITQQDISVFKPSCRAILPSKAHQKQQGQYKHPKQRPSFFKEPKQQLKLKINKIEQQNSKQFQDSRVKQFALLNNIQNDHIEEMLKMREEMLQKRQCEQLTKLNEKLVGKEITQKDFLWELGELTQNFQTQKASIDKAREDINKGYNAAIKLIKEAFCDAKKVGYKLPLSKSSDAYKSNKHLGFGVLTSLNSIIIDQLTLKDPLFLTKNVRTPNSQKKGSVGEVIAKKKEQNQPFKGSYNDKFVENKDLQLQIQKNEKQNNQFIRSGSISSSSSIINNLSSNSFKDQFFEVEHSPKHQAIFQTPESDLKSNVFNLNSCEFDDMSQQSSEIEFSQEQLRRFRKAQPFDPSIADMNRNVMIGKDFIQMQKSYDHDHSSPFENQKGLQNQGPQSLKLRLYRQVYEIQENESQSYGIPIYLNQRKRQDPKVDLITEKQIDILIFQISCQLLMKPLFSEKLLFQKRQQMFGIKRVNDQCRKVFIAIVEDMLPSQQCLVSKLNQNISPLPRQLLKCMRIDFSQEDQGQDQQQEEEYEQIGKYQMILDQELCNQAIEKYHEKLQGCKQEQAQITMLTCETVASLRNQYQGFFSNEAFEQKAFSYLGQRQKFVKNRREHCEGIRWQFINMELHCLFDAWNQQIIQLKGNTNGFSGIGLNQLTLSMIDRNKKVKQHQVQDVMRGSKFKIMKLLGYQGEIIDQIKGGILKRHQTQNQDSRVSAKSLKQQLQESQGKYSWVHVPNRQIQEELDSEQQSKWVYYSDQALSYGLELVYLIQEQIFGELAKQSRRLMLKLQPN